MINKIFLDTNILINLVDHDLSHHMQATFFIGGLYAKDEIGLVSPYVINELHYYLQKKLRTKSAEKKCLDTLELSRIEIIDLIFTRKDIDTILGLTNTHKLKTTDAYHAFYCKKFGIKKIATFDKDFKKIPWLKVVP